MAYLELELKYSNFAEVEALFTRCLKTVLSVDLWKFYLGYIRRINQGDSGTTMTPEARAIIEKAYEYVLNNVGIDKEAGSIWADYIYFLKSAEVIWHGYALGEECKVLMWCSIRLPIHGKNNARWIVCAGRIRKQ